MFKIKGLSLFMAGLAFALIFTSGCAAFRESTSVVDVDRMGHYDEDYDAADLRTLSRVIVGQLISSPFLASRVQTPVMMISEVRNDTDEHIDTRSLTDQMRVKLIQSGKIRFVNESRRREIVAEQGYQAANVTPGQNVAIGRQLGAGYMITGALAKISKGSGRQVRVSQKKFSYYKLTMEVNDIESGEIVWIAEHEFAREASKPLIGW